MDAIVLSFDTQLGLAELTHKRYADLWPTNRLTFRIPVNGSAPGTALAYLEEQSNCLLIPTPSTIGASMRALLDGIADDAWVFWCIDDRYPIWVEADALDEICARLDSCPDQVEEVKLLRWKEEITPQAVEVGSLPFLVQRPRTRQRGFWHHHFIRAGTLRRVFTRKGLDDACRIRDVMRSVIDDNARSRNGGRRARDGGAERQLFRGQALVPTRPLIRLGEPLKGRILTANGLAELHRRNCEIPPYRSDGRNKIFTWSEAKYPDAPGSTGTPKQTEMGPALPVGFVDGPSLPLPLDVLLLCGDLDAGGTQRVASNLAGGWSEQGYRVAVASFCDAAPDFFAVPPEVSRERMRDAPVPSLGGHGPATLRFQQRLRVRQGLRRRLTRFAVSLPDRVQGLLRTRVAAWVVIAHARRLDRIRWIRHTIETRRPALVISLGPGANVSALLAAKGLPCRVVISERNDIERQPRDFPLPTLCRWLYKKADVVTANSFGTVAALGARVPPDRVAYVPNPLTIPQDAWTGPPPPGFAGPCVLIVARLVHQKNHALLLDAFGCLPPELDQWRLAIVGTGDREKSLRRRADRLGIADRVDWHGRTDNPYAFYRHSDIFALPSHFEGMPNALLEAMSFGLPPIVADRTPGPLEVVRHGETGLVTATDDPESLASAITMLATCSELRRSLGDAARKEVSRFETGEALGRWSAVVDLPRREPMRATRVSQ